MVERIPPFIADQQWSLLGDFETPQQYLDTVQFRPGRPGAGLQLATEQSQPDPWLPIDDHHDVLHNTLTLPDGQWVDLSRLVITTDAGIGKSCAVEWLRAGLLQSQLKRRHIVTKQGAASGSARKETESKGWLAFVVPSRILREGSPEQVHQRLRDYMVAEICSRLVEHQVPRHAAQDLVDRHRRRGRLVLLFDGLDHLGDCEALVGVTQSRYWRDCHLVVAGRPYALQRDWQRLFHDRRWRFIRAEEFTDDQQTRYLGNDKKGEPKVKSIPEEARQILTVPRVLYYIRGLPDEKLKEIKAAADVYLLAIYELIKRGMEQSVVARKMACDGRTPERPQDRAILKTFELLSLIAFEMVASQIRVPIASQSDGQPQTLWKQRPNFYRIKRGSMAKFQERLESRFASTDFGRDWRALSALNTVLAHAVFDADVEGLVEIEFRNRSLQEFLCAYYLAQHARPEDQQGNQDSRTELEQPPSGHTPAREALSSRIWRWLGRLGRGYSEADSQLPSGLWQWIYLPLEPETEDYYYVWQFLTEMPEDAIQDDVWLESIAPLYLPAMQHRQARGWIAKRSSEMIFRSWPRLSRLCEQHHERALAIRAQWWDEFEEVILAGKRGIRARWRARGFQRSFLPIPEGTFTMGTPDAKQGKMPDGLRGVFETFLSNAPQNEADRDAYIRQETDKMVWPPGRGGLIARRNFERTLAEALSGGMRAVERRFAPKNEHVHDVDVAPFQLSRSPCLNAWYRLFDPDHGQIGMIAPQYQVSPTSNHPVVYISWFDAWAFCQWARWDGKSCRLPWEHEWEYACKFRTPSDQNYWWGEEFDGRLANAEQRLETNIPTRRHVNPFTRELDAAWGIGLQDMSGNVWEWCQDRYRAWHQWQLEDDPGDCTGSRVLRGGSFDDFAVDCRSSCRNRRQPAYSILDVGFRVARARKS